MNNDIFFSVMICCYNSEKYLNETLDSVVNQTYKNWEILAINDGSTDNTEKILMSFKNKGIAIRYYKQKNKGFASARNKAMDLAKGEWIAIIDHDDICMPSRLEVQASHIKTNPEAKLFFANTIHFNNENPMIRHQFDRIKPYELDLRAEKVMNNLLRHGCFIDTESVVFNKKAALDIGAFNTSYKYVVDFDFFLRMGSKYDMFASQEIISKWRIHKQQATQTMRYVIHDERKKMFNEYLWFNGVTNKTRFAMLFNLVKNYIKDNLIKWNIH
ncbi:MAG: glycosyltransferase family 2 protein [Spirochaetia bacterium]|nr:glycosyltransferase family 2 protein [Spirochaetia bacterium]